MTDPVQDRNDDDERAVLELAQLEALLDAEQARLDDLMHRDPLRVLWFGVPDDPSSGR
jgi:hypothetical protein